ncbi:nucleoside diphosphate kinase regulator [Brucella endophytica]|uniref:Nucleoside diphosphate kinase regulator n=1 Tax=Brucella endophytica TaxID=1963359 RepID=A0A916SL64_9HYPH|nr:nucleoside diphosphate kinase regulator [Brucella endophytica]GGB05892.1 nucleoside diphosphate kinase regulator [Brucella endophytica]
MTQPKNSRRKPRIVVSDIDYKRLTDLATGAESRFPEVAEELLAELDRAHVVVAGSVAAKVVRMGSTVEFRSDSAQQRRVTLVYPGEADIAQNRISILTPIGAALIGLSTGQSITWTARDGREHELTVIAVEQRHSPLVVSAYEQQRSVL